MSLFSTALIGVYQSPCTRLILGMTSRGVPCAPCAGGACSFQLSECSTDIPESSGSPSPPPLPLGHLGKETNPTPLWPPPQEGAFEILGMAGRPRILPLNTELLT